MTRCEKRLPWKYRHGSSMPAPVVARLASPRHELVRQIHAPGDRTSDTTPDKLFARVVRAGGLTKERADEGHRKQRTEYWHRQACVPA